MVRLLLIFILNFSWCFWFLLHFHVLILIIPLCGRFYDRVVPNWDAKTVEDWILDKSVVFYVGGWCYDYSFILTIHYTCYSCCCYITKKILFSNVWKIQFSSYYSLSYFGWYWKWLFHYKKKLNYRGNFIDGYHLSLNLSTNLLTDLP